MSHISIVRPLLIDVAVLTTAIAGMAKAVISTAGQIAVEASGMALKTSQGAVMRYTQDQSGKYFAKTEAIPEADSLPAERGGKQESVVEIRRRAAQQAKEEQDLELAVKKKYAHLKVLKELEAHGFSYQIENKEDGSIVVTAAK